MEIKTDLNINPRTYWPNTKHIIKYAFSIVGEGMEKHYFELHDVFNSGYERALSAIAFYHEVSKNMSNEFLDAGLLAADNCLKSTKDPESGQWLMRPGEAQAVVKILRERSKLPKEPELMYKFASVIFFDQSENPEVYEYKYCAEKIDFWKTTDMDVFFSPMPIRRLIPYIDAAGDNLKAFSNMMTSRTRRESSFFLSFLSTDQMKEYPSLSE